MSRSRQALRFAWFACLLLVVVGSLLPDTSRPIRLLARLGISDKLQHFAGYAALAFLPVVHERPRVVIGTALALIGLGVLLEFGQSLASRNFEIADMMADSVGVFAGLASGWPLRRYVLRRIG